MYIYHAFINALSAHIIHIIINLIMIFYTHAEQSPTKRFTFFFNTHSKRTHTH